MTQDARSRASQLARASTGCRTTRSRRSQRSHRRHRAGRAVDHRRARVMVLAGDELRQPVAPRQPRSCAGAGDLRRLPGHDDVWLPCHLQALVATTEREGLDVATTRCFSIGPPGSNALSLSGAGLRARREVTIPPSALCHRLDIVGRPGGWIAHRRLPPDHAPDREFIERLNAASTNTRALRRVGVFTHPAVRHA